MKATKVFVARLAGCAVFDSVGDKVGKVRDILVVYRRASSPRVVGFIVEVPGRRRVFLSINRVTSINPGQIITTGDINLRRFEQRGGEVRIIAELLGREVTLVDGTGTASIDDVAIIEEAPGEWAISELYLRRPKTSASPFAKGHTVSAAWDGIRDHARPGSSQSASHLLAAYEDLLPADLASALLDLPEQRMLEVAEELSDARLADALEEMPEHEQVEILNRLDDSRAADVLDQMQPDDAADLIAQLPDERSETLLELMEPDEADDVRMLLTHNPDTAGGLMTTEPIIVSADTTVAEGLALVRRSEVPVQLAAAVCVTLPPYEPPTGRYLGVVHFQKMLRYPPMERLGTLLDTHLEPVHAGVSAAEVSRILATYDLISVPVVDDQHRLLGVVTIDDVLDYLLPDDWRSHDDDEPAKLLRADTTPIEIITTRDKEGNG
ncbi:MAG TPA: CBS domain-containing protein [Terrimesophilobacter sp.]|nr:CBS domain-containing protein [Terrimesophilobacter sp.]HRQ00560.1 CBS domain-containing protein [Terrimesophilobacter sp.]